ncbi:MAG TPA: hypothetical protein VMH02_03695, partial [Verrucomicrobiae bacterium]|nr:hypothetical protein [Verrucomicrobiae bacterium]
MLGRFGIGTVLAGTLALGACTAHGGGAFEPPVAQQNERASPDAAAGVPMTFTVTIPHPKADASAAQRHEWFVAATTQSIQLSIYKPHSLHDEKHLLGTQVFGLNAGAKGCKTTAAARICTQTLKLPPPAVDVVAATFDQKPHGLKIPTGAKQLAAADLVDQTVTAGKALKFTLGGVPASVALTIPASTLAGRVQTASMHGVAPLSKTLGLQALDADGNVILTDGYVDAAGASTGIAVSTSASRKTCGSYQVQNGGASGTNILVTAPTPRGIVFAYGTPSVATPFGTAGYCSFSITAKVAGSVGRGAFVLTGPQLTEFAIGSNEPLAIAAGPDGNVWFTGTSESIGVVNLSSGDAITNYPLPDSPRGIVSAGGYLWTSSWGGEFFQLSTSGGIVNEFPYSDPEAQSSEQLAGAPDGSFWFAETGSQRVVRMTTSGGVSYYQPVTASPSPYPEGVAAGPDGNMWFTEVLPSKIERISTAGTNAQEFSTSGVAANPNFIVAGPDGNLWFTNCYSTFNQLVPSGSKAGTVTSYSAKSLSSGNNPQFYGIAPNAADDSLWAAGIAGSLVARISAASDHTVTSFAVSHPAYWITTGPDG